MIIVYASLPFDPNRRDDGVDFVSELAIDSCKETDTLVYGATIDRQPSQSRQVLRE